MANNNYLLTKLEKGDFLGTPLNISHGVEYSELYNSDTYFSALLQG